MGRQIRTLSTLLLAVVLLASCASDKGPAEAAIKAAEEALGAARADAARYVPDQLKAVESALASAKDKFAKSDYKGALADAQGIAAKAKELATAAAGKKAELAKSWESLSAGLPKVVEAIQSRVDILSKSKKLPANMTAEKLASAKAGLADITQQWAAATDASKGGNLADAVTKATAVKAKAAEVLTTLGMPVPDALKG